MSKSMPMLQEQKNKNEIIFVINFSNIINFICKKKIRVKYTYNIVYTVNNKNKKLESA